MTARRATNHRSNIRFSCKTVRCAACQRWPMKNLPVVIEPVGDNNYQVADQFLAGWVSDGDADARAHLADHCGGEGASLVAVRSRQVIGIVSMLWVSNYAGFAERGLPLVHQLAVAGPFRRQGVGMRLMQAAEDLARDREATEPGVTVGLFDAYGPAQRLYARRGYLPDGRGACQGQWPLRNGMQVIIDDDLIIWLTTEGIVSREGGGCTGSTPSSA